MGRPRRTSRPKLLTEVELEIMSTLWQLERGTVREVLAKLPKRRTLAYTSVSTMLRILEDKRLVRSRKDGKAYVYVPAVTKTEYEGRSLRHLAEKVFDGTPSAMVMRLIDDAELSTEELREIKRRLEEKLT